MAKRCMAWTLGLLATLAMPVLCAGANAQAVAPPVVAACPSGDQWCNFWHTPIDIFTLGAAIVGLLQASAALLQWKIYKRQAGIMEVQTELSKMQTEFNKELPLLTQRALLSFDHISQQFHAARNEDDQAWWEIKIWWRNYGPTPAKSIKFCASYECVGVGALDDRFAPSLPQMMQEGMPVAPGGTFSVGQFRISEHDAHTTLDAGQGGLTNRVICTARILYQDVFARVHQHQAQICLQVKMAANRSEPELEVRPLAKYCIDGDS